MNRYIESGRYFNCFYKLLTKLLALENSMTFVCKPYNVHNVLGRREANDSIDLIYDINFVINNYRVNCQ